VVPSASRGARLFAIHDPLASKRTVEGIVSITTILAVGLIGVGTLAASALIAVGIPLLIFKRRS
jgi:hypothetical protein